MEKLIKLSKPAHDILVFANQFAQDNNQKYISISHIAYSVFENPLNKSYIKKNIGVDVSDLKEEIKESVISDTKIKRNAENWGKSFLVTEFMFNYLKKEAEAKEDMDENDFLALLIRFLLDLNKREVETEVLNIILKSIKREELSLILEWSEEPDDIDDEELSDLLAEGQEDDFEEVVDLIEKKGLSGREGLINTRAKNKKSKPDFIFDLMNKLSDGDTFDNLYPIAQKINQIEYSLSKKEKSVPILVGENGVGKTSLVYSFYKKILQKESSAKLQNKKIYELDLGRMFAGCMYRGSLEEKMITLFDYLKDNKDIILFVDNLKISKNNTQQEEFVNSFINEMERSHLKCIVSLTPKDYNKITQMNSGFENKCSKIPVEEPSNEDVKSIIGRGIHSYEKYHNIQFSEQLIDDVIYLSNRYIPNLKFPAKAFEIIDEVGALHSSGIDSEGNGVATKESILKVIENKTKIKLKKDVSEISNIINLEKNIKTSIFGQDEAIERVSSSIMVSGAGLQNENKPYLSMMFTGTTGVGKTELVKELEKNLNRKLIKFDMSEYSEAHTVSRLIGSPPGYIGYDEGGQLSKLVKEDPYSIVLFDEIEKANSKIFNIFLQILDEGCVTDSHGEKISFKNTIVVFTSNAGVEEKNKNTLGFSGTEEKNKINLNVLEKYFRPEFLNRIDSIVEFGKLNKEVMLNIAEKQLSIFGYRLSKKGVKLKYTPKVKSWLADAGYDERMGARPMERAVNKNIVESFSKEYMQYIYAGKVVKECSISIKNNNIIIECS